MSSVDKTLEDRGKNYGNFLHDATIQMSLKGYLHGTENWDTLWADQQAALDMFAVKIARILNGNPNHIDSWHDIAGYATLVVKRLEEDAAKSNG